MQQESLKSPAKAGLSWRKILEIGVIILMFGAMGWAVITYREETWKAFQQADLGLLTLAFLLLLLNSALYAGVWQFAIRSFAPRVTYKQAFVVVSIAGLARYVPGGVWGPLSAIYAGERRGLSRASAIAGLALTMLILLIASLAIIMASLPYWRSEHWVDTIKPLGWLFPLTLIFAHPRIVRFGFGKVLPFVGGKVAEINQTEINYLAIGRTLLLAIIFWLENGLTSWVLVRAFAPADWDTFASMTGIFAAAWLSSVILFFLPGGIGAMEGSLGLLLGLYMGQGAVVAVIAMNRILKTLNDLICAGLALWLAREPEPPQTADLERATDEQAPLQGRI